MQQIYRRKPSRMATSVKLLCDFIEIALRHGCSPVNLLHIFITPFFKNTFEWLLLDHPILQQVYTSWTSMLKHTCSWRVNLLYYEHWTDKHKYFYVRLSNFVSRARRKQELNQQANEESILMQLRDSSKYQRSYRKIPELSKTK